ncbi:antitoxin [Mycobacterium tuberculosis]|nr:antitoxin [Mycobacterium tuberculosis]
MTTSSGWSKTQCIANADPMKQVINDALRRALAPPVKRQEQYRLEPHESAVRSGLDLAGFNKLADELEDEALLDATRRAR